ncbi:hypothetical protein Tco_0691393 [Tanacetum coccineum]
MKAVKEKEQLQKTLDSWKDSSKNLWRLIESGMSSNSKVGLGFEIQRGSKPKLNSVRPNINTGRININSVRPRVNAVSPKVNTVRSKQPVPYKTSNSEHPLKNMVDRGIFDSGCSGHMTGNKDQLEDFEEFNKGSVTFGGASEVTNSAGTSQTPSLNASEEKDEDVELIVVPSSVRNTEEKAALRKSSTNSKKDEILTKLQQEMKISSTNTLEDNPKVQAFRRELEEIALKH